MKFHHFIYTLQLVIISISTTAAQCDVGVKYLRSDQEVQEFATEYQGCPVVNANIVIENGVTNLLPLTFLEGINGNLRFNNTAEELQFDGLENLIFITDDLSLQNVYFNEDDPAFPNLLSVDSSIWIYNSTFTNPNFFEKLEHIGDKLNIFQSELGSLMSFRNIRVLNDFFISGTNLVNFEGLNNLDSIRGNARWEYAPFLSFSGLENLSYIERIRIYDCDAFTNLEGLSGLRTINEYSEITRCDSFSSLLGLGNVVFNGQMRFEYNPRLEDCHLLSICELLMNGAGGLGFHSNADGCDSNIEVKNQCESSVDGFDFLSQADLDQFAIDHPDTMHVIGNINVKGNDIIDLSALNKIKSTQGSISVKTNASLSNLNGFEAIESIGHSLNIDKNDKLLNTYGFHKLKSIGRDLVIESCSDLADLDGLNNLKSIGRDLLINSCTNLADLDGFNRLNSIGRDLAIEACDELRTISGLSNVNLVGRDVNVVSNPVLQSLEGFSGLTKIGGLFFAYFNHNLQSLTGLENLDSIAGKFTVGYSDRLKSIDEFNPAYVAGGISIIRLDSLKAIHGYNRLTEIQNGSLTIWYGDQLEDLVGFQNLEIISNKLSFYDLGNLRSIGGLGSLRELGILDIDRCDSLQSFLPSLEIVKNEFLLSWTGLAFFPNIKLGDSLEKFEIENNPYLLEIPHFQNMSYVIGNLSVSANPLIQNLDGLSELDSIGIGLYISGNTRLNDISALAQLRDIDYLSIRNNPLLSDCNIRAFCDLLYQFPKKVVINGNQPECDKSTIDCSFYGFSGHVYFDTNLNGVRDTGEYNMPNMRIDNTHDQSWNFTNSLGKWYYATDESIVHMFEWVEDEKFHLTSDSMRYTRLFMPGADANNNLDFGIYHNEPIHKSETRIYPWAFELCNTVVPFRISVMNNGSFTDSFFVDLKYDELLRFDSVGFNLELLDTLNRQLSWNTGPVRPFENRNYLVYLQIASEIHLGETFKIEVFTRLDENIEPDHTSYGAIVLCSYDPNDKLVSPAPRQEDHLSLKSDPFIYTVRFQNTGNIDAMNIQIRDTLDVSLDWSTFRVIASSHTLHTELSYDGIATFSFNNIFLPDSSSNPEGSQGFVTYTIDPLPGLDDYIHVRNTAYIYFDGNQPIITNTTLNILVDEFPVVAVYDNNQVADWSMHPNPVQSILYIDSIPDLQDGHIVDLLGRTVWSSDFIQGTIDVNGLSEGVYWLVLRDRKGESARLFVKR